MKRRKTQYSLKLDKITIEDLSRQIAVIYKNVKLVQSPLYRWIQIINDATILGEDIRRKRSMKAFERAGRILMRLLSFLGHYLYIHPLNTRYYDSLGNMVAYALRLKSYQKYYGRMRLEEGPTRWILAKYPYTCAKCGNRPCVCPIFPWIFEERRENPGPFMDYVREVELKRKELTKFHTIEEFTLPTLFDFFESIYRNQYYNADPWKITMHIYEELGEATTELGRLEFALQGLQQKFKLKSAMRDVRNHILSAVDDATRNITDAAMKTRLELEIKRKVGFELAQFKKQNWLYFIKLVSLRFKEEVADVFSWLIAITNNLEKEIKIDKLSKLAEGYTEEIARTQTLVCDWCKQRNCRKHCLPGHEIYEEILEKVLKL